MELSTQNAEISDLVFALEASNTENKYLHEEIERLGRRSQADIDPDLLNPEQHMKKQVMEAFTSYDKVRRKNEEREQQQAQLRKQMLQKQSDPNAVVESLATNMGFWILGEKLTDLEGVDPSDLGDDPTKV